jgi:hypothetical protein
MAVSCHESSWPALHRGLDDDGRGSMACAAAGMGWALGQVLPGCSAGGHWPGPSRWIPWSVSLRGGTGAPGRCAGRWPRSVPFCGGAGVRGYGLAVVKWPAGYPFTQGQRWSWWQAAASTPGRRGDPHATRNFPHCPTTCDRFWPSARWSRRPTEATQAGHHKP